jgi:hypothetical protein
VSLQAVLGLFTGISMRSSCLSCSKPWNVASKKISSITVQLIATAIRDRCYSATNTGTDITYREYIATNTGTARYHLQASIAILRCLPLATCH